MLDPERNGSGIKLLVVVPFHEGDAACAVRMFNRIAALGGMSNTVLLVADQPLTNGAFESVKTAASSAAAKVIIHRQPESPKRKKWPVGPNAAWLESAKYVQEQKLGPWLFVEPDCVFVSGGAVEKIEDAYGKCCRPFMGPVIECKPPLPAKVMNGVAVYPEGAFSKLAPYITKRMHVAFDVSTAGAVTPLAADTKLIQFALGKDRTPVKWISQKQIHPGSVLIHGDKTDSLERLVGIMPTRVELPRGVVAVPDCSSRRESNNGDAGRATTGLCAAKICKTFYHSGDFGDIIYALPTIKALGGGDLILGPIMRSHVVRVPMSQERFKWIEPLLKRQPYLGSVQYSAIYPSKDVTDLNAFRNLWFDPVERKKRNVNLLYEAYPAVLGIECPSQRQQWLFVDAAPPPRPVIVNRTERYRNDAFPWKHVADFYRNNLCFVGLENEHKRWTNAYGRAQFLECGDALVLARHIAGAKLFIGNQSLACAIALGLDQWCIQEAYLISPDCALLRHTLQCSHRDALIFPPIPRQLVSCRRKGDGFYHIGPRADAYGIGDALSLTPLIVDLKDVVLHLPPAMLKCASLFHNLCTVMISDVFPVFQDDTSAHACASPFAVFKRNPTTPLAPTIRLTKHELAEGAEFVGEKPTICFTPTCALQWKNVRQPPATFWRPLLSKLSETHRVLQFGTPLDVGGGKRIEYVGMPDLRKAAAIFAASGRYVGVDTGDLHIMRAVGGKVLAYYKDCPEAYNKLVWQYSNELTKYIEFGEAEQTLEQSYDFITS